MFKLFERWTEPFPENCEAQPPQGLLKFCVFYARGFGWPLLIIAVTSGGIAAFEVVLFAFMGHLVDWLGAYDQATFWAEEGENLLWMSAFCVVTLPILAILSSLVRYQSVMGNLPMSIRWRMHKHLLGQSMKFYHDEFSGRISTKLMQTALATRAVIMRGADIFVYIGVYIGSMLALLGQLDIRLALPMAVWCVAYTIFQILLIPRLAEISRIQADARSDMTGRIVDAYTNISTVKLFAHTERETEYAHESMNGYMQTVYRQFRLLSILDGGISLGNYLLTFSSGVVGIWLWSAGKISVGAIAVGLSLAFRLSAMSHWLGFELSTLFENIGTLRDGIQMMGRPIDVQDVPNAPELMVEKGAISFEHVDFTYAADALTTATADKGDGKEGATVVLKDLNLWIKPGEKIGLVGRSGAGKSTLISALLRFYDLHSGVIKIDDQDISKVSQDSLRRQIAMVTQDTSLLHRTIRENIMYGRPEATDEELRCAIEGAQATDFIEELSDQQGGNGLDAQVGERGVKLSGGQRQRIAIARVLLKDAPILVLDEATSALDSEVEAAIQESLMSLMEGKTVIAIAHRLSTIAAMDRLVIMDKGKIVEEGTHDSLIKKGGLYSQLWNRQTGGYIPEQ